jgi:Xaa-Pro aminopeptidase
LGPTRGSIEKRLVEQLAAVERPHFCYTPPMSTTPPAADDVSKIPLAEYQSRRQKLFDALKGAAAIVFAGEGAAPLLGKWRPDQSFLYLTGLEAEAGAAVLFDPTNENPKRRITLFLRPINPEMDRWDGYRDPISQALKDATGFETVLRTSHLPGMLTAAARRAKRVACLHGFAVYPNPVSPDLAVFKQIAERIPSLAIEDQTQLLPRMRAVKSQAELALMQQAADATAAGYDAILKLIKPGLTEAHLDQALEQAYRAQGASGVAYNSIVGSGLNATVLHYMDNRQPLVAGDLIVIDSAARFSGYAADVTRTYPVSGKFTPEQREVYETVLRAEEAAIKALRPGVTHTEVDAAARDVIEKAGYADAFIHNIGHQLGLEVHDITPDGPLVEGMVMTIEPGIYLPDRKLGVRIEDDLIITKTGARSMTDRIPKTIEAIERAMGR